MSNQIAIVTPVLDDWESFERLLGEISFALHGLPIGLDVVAIDDGSSELFAPDALALPAGAIRNIEILHLGFNLGHQRAIAVGLAEIAQRKDLDGVLVMDCDGEDRPADLPKLLAAGRDHPGRVVVARRTQRSEARPFKIGYFLYKFLFALLTGYRIDFGNFSLMPMACVRRLVLMPEIWNNLPAAILRSRIGIVSVPTERGHRYAGRSRMNWIGLVAHGLSAMSVYVDVVFVRMLFGASLVGGLTVIGIITAVAIRFLTPLAIPGWTTTVVGVLFLLLMQIVIMVIAMLLLVLAGRNGRPLVPGADAGQFVAERQHFVLEQRSPSLVDSRIKQDELFLSGHRA
jgi:hypothetical protein